MPDTPIPNIDWNGHFKNGERTAWMKEVWAREQRFLENERLCATLLRALLGIRECPYCHVDIELGQSGDGWKITEPCPCPEGIDFVEFDLNIPSGKMVVANDLRDWFPGEPSFGINQTIGLKEATLWAAKRGLAYGFVGNTCPGVYRTRKGYLIANPPCHEDWDKEKKKYVRIKAEPFRHREVAGICTDLWWYSICDYDELQYRAKMLGIDPPNEKEAKVVPVPPGLYHFKHYFGVHDAYGQPNPVIFAEVTRVGKALKVKGSEVNDFLMESLPAGRVLQQSIRDYPTLYTQKYLYDENGKFKGWGPSLTWNEMNEEQRRWSLQRAADHFMCTLGNGVDWHPNGHPKGHPVDDDIQDIDIPPFNFQAHWYPFSTDRDHCVMTSVNLAPSWAKLAFNVVQSILKYGVAPTTSSDHYPASYYEKKATEVYKVLREKYPERIDEEFDAWFLARGESKT